MAPSLATTRWQGMTSGIGVLLAQFAQESRHLVAQVHAHEPVGRRGEADGAQEGHGDPSGLELHGFPEDGPRVYREPSVAFKAFSWPARSTFTRTTSPGFFAASARARSWRERT